MSSMLKDKSRVGMVKVTKQTYLLMTRIFTSAPHHELFNGCQFLENPDNLCQIWSLCRHFLAQAYDKEVSNAKRLAFSFKRCNVT